MCIVGFLFSELFSVVVVFVNCCCMAWMAPSIPTSRPTQSSEMPHACFASVMVCFMIIFAHSLLQDSPMHIGRTPGFLLSAINLPAMAAL